MARSNLRYSIGKMTAFLVKDQEPYESLSDAVRYRPYICWEAQQHNRWLTIWDDDEILAVLDVRTPFELPIADPAPDNIVERIEQRIKEWQDTQLAGSLDSWNEQSSIRR